jgi:hypothetical protein
LFVSRTQTGWIFFLCSGRPNFFSASLMLSTETAATMGPLVSCRARSICGW